MLLDSLTVLGSLHNYTFQRKATNSCFVLPGRCSPGYHAKSEKSPLAWEGQPECQETTGMCNIRYIYLFKPVYSKQKIYSVIYYVMTEFVKFE